jgi:hypothetical protein
VREQDLGAFLDHWYNSAGENGRTTSIWPGLDSSLSGYTAPTGQAQRLTVDLRQLGVGQATVRLFADTSSTDRTLHPVRPVPVHRLTGRGNLEEPGTSSLSLTGEVGRSTNMLPLWWMAVALGGSLW